MRTILISLLVAVLMAGVSLAQSTTEAPDSARKAEMMATYMELMQPGPEHKLLESLAGDWTQEVQIWMAPGQQPTEFTGSAAAKMILGGRFLEIKFTSGEGMFAGEGLNLLGYDRRNKVYTSVGFDTWGTYFVTAEGIYDEATKTISLYGEAEDKTFNLTEKYTMNMQILDEDTYTWEVIVKDAEQMYGVAEFKMVEVTHRRVK